MMAYSALGADSTLSHASIVKSPDVGMEVESAWERYCDEPASRSME